MGLISLFAKKNKQDQFLDALGLITQGFVTPLLSFLFAKYFLFFIFPSLWQSISIPPVILFFLPFTLVDYIYYWNHRLLHSKMFWIFHKTHHSSEKMDIFVTSRNSVWTGFLLVYMWFHAFIIFFTRDSQIYVYGMWVMGLLDLWRHSGWKTPRYLKSFGFLLILPEDHEWHHSRMTSGINFGANLNIWDKFHGTYYCPQNRAEFLGLETRGNFMNEFFFPWRLK